MSNQKNKTMMLSKNTYKRRKIIFICGMLSIPVIHFIIFWGILNFNVILLSFQKLDVITGRDIFTLENFDIVLNRWTSGELKVALLNTLYTFGFLVIFLLPWSIFLTYFLYKKIVLSSFWRIMLFIPNILPAVAMTSIFENLIYTDGPIGVLWEILFKTDTPMFLVDPKIAQHTIIFYLFWTNFGGQFILISSAMSRIPKEIIESSRLDGVGMGREIFNIIIPLCWPTISMLLLIQIAGMFMATGPVLLLTEGRAKTDTISFWIYNRIYGEREIYYPSLVGLICTVILFPIVLLSRWGLGKLQSNLEY